MLDERVKSCMKLAMTPEVGAVTAMRLIRRFGSAEAALKASLNELTSVERIGDKTAAAIVEGRAKIDIDAVSAKVEGRGAKYITFEDSAYPRLLAEAPDAPIGLYVQGDVDLNAPCIAIVGSRKCSLYGQGVARKLGAVLAQSGLTVVSGMARGIDTAAHLGALEAGGKTVAVLGCGLDIVYPPENIDLYKRLAAEGALVSEFVLGTRADKQTFPIRNRIIAGLCLGVIVVESDSKGGSMITARLAAEYGRDVFAVPGRIDQPSSKGCHELIRDGATLVTCADDILESFSFAGRAALSLPFETSKKDDEAESACALPPDEAAVYAVLKEGAALDASSVQESSGLKTGATLAALTMLELKKLISKRADGAYEKRFKN